MNGIGGTPDKILSSDESLGRLLEAIRSDPPQELGLPPVLGLSHDQAMALAETLLERGWIAAKATNRGDGRLLDVAYARITPLGDETLKRIMSTTAHAPRIEGGPAMSITEKGRHRFEYMQLLYEATNGATTADVNMWELGDRLGWDRPEIDDTVHYLEAEGLLTFVLLGGGIAITHYGVREVEQALTSPEAPTEHFPPVFNIINVQSMQSSQIQQGTSASSQHLILTDPDQKAEIAGYVAELRGILDQLQLDQDDRLEIDAELGTVDSQLGSPRSKAGLIRASLARIGALLATVTVATGNVVHLAEYIDKLHRLISGL